MSVSSQGPLKVMSYRPNLVRDEAVRRLLWCLKMLHPASRAPSPPPASASEAAGERWPTSGRSLVKDEQLYRVSALFSKRRFNASLPAGVAVYP